MEKLEHILVWFAVLLGIGWSAVFICALASKQRGTMPRFFGTGRYRLPKTRPLAWWQHLIRFPFYCVFIPAFALCLLILVPPMFVIEKWIFRS